MLSLFCFTDSVHFLISGIVKFFFLSLMSFARDLRSLLIFPRNSCSPVYSLSLKFLLSFLMILSLLLSLFGSGSFLQSVKENNLTFSYLVILR